MLTEHILLLVVTNMQLWNLAGRSSARPDGWFNPQWRFVGAMYDYRTAKHLTQRAEL